MIRLALAAATACAVVWAAGGNLRSLVPDTATTREVLERSAQALEEAASVVGEAASSTEPEPVEIPELREFGPEAPPSTAPAFAPSTAPAFAPSTAPALAPSTAPDDAHAEVVAADEPLAEWREPLDAAQAEAVRCRLDRVMSLASGGTR